MEETSDCLQSLSPETRDTMAIGKRTQERALEAETGQQTTRRFFASPADGMLESLPQIRSARFVYLEILV